ncbi:hypothetical protein [Bacillus ndiopicus]|uniref:hypothetical protein n=1 Tax=Bacillus ndiopicus TaxID=1347368 RepID=UPI0005AAD600|nr:hypothetical protein [Bacillus ndiopicus]
MDGKEIFTNLKNAFEEAVDFTLKNGMQKGGITKEDLQQSKLFEAILIEANLRLKVINKPRQDGIADLFTGRRKYEEY